MKLWVDIKISVLLILTSAFPEKKQTITALGLRTLIIPVSAIAND